ncbi:MAG TPA: branched-chain amino acid ABC transporter permease [Micromonosporaceae bacterium]|nr:branched-chain amino acid ABC transporter permease [Micromonosporaceae bacterium]
MSDRWHRLSFGWRLAVILAGVVFVYSLPWLGRYPIGGHNYLVPGLYNLRTDTTPEGSNFPYVLFFCSIYVLIAVGLNVVVGLAGLLDLGYVGFFAIGAYSVALFGAPTSPVVGMLRNQFGLPQGWAVAWAACIPIAIALTMISGVILGWPTLRLRGDYLAIVTLGFGEIIRIVARNSSFTNANRGIFGVPPPPGTSGGEPLFNPGDPIPWYFLAISVTIIFILAVRVLERSRVGRAWLAIREDEDAAEITGVPSFRFKLWAFAIGAALGGASGMLFASRLGFIEPNNFQLNFSILFVSMVVIGGSGNMVGVAVGAILLTYLPERFRPFADWRPFAFGVALVVVMILRPQGLIPSSRRSRELEDRAKEAPANV